MGKIKWFCALHAIVLMLSVQLPSALGSNAEYVALPALRDEVQDGWHETYEFNGRTIVVDIDPTVPDIDKFPIIQVERISGVLPHSDDVTVISSDTDGIVIEKRSNNEAFCYGYGEPYYYLEPNAQVENSPMTAQEAGDFLREIALKYQSQYGSFGLEARPVVSASREYAVLKSKSGEKIGIDSEKPMTEMGHYSIWFYQTFHGIPKLESRSMGPPENFQVDVPGPICEIYGNVASEDNYSLVVFAGREVEVREEDVPLISFAPVKAEIERLMREGYLREIYEVSLGYNAISDPQNPRSQYLFVPVWRVRGLVYDRPGAPDQVLSETDQVLIPYAGGQTLSIDAQTGEVVVSTLRDYITWTQLE